MRNLHVARGSNPVLRGIDLAVRESEMVALVGPNGAGKTTLMRALTGLDPWTSGSVTLDGRSLPPRRPDLVVRSGMALVPEGRHIFGDLTVRENLLLGATVRRDGEIVDDIMRWGRRFEILGERLDRPAGELSGGEQQMLAITRGLMSRPRILLLDEPSLGLAPMVVDEVFDVLAELRSAGITILLVEQAARLAVAAADRSYVIVGGRIRATGTADELAGGHLVDAYFGGS